MRRSGKEDGRDDQVSSSLDICDSVADLPDFKSDEVSESRHGNLPLPSETKLAENAGTLAKETELKSSSKLECPKNLDELGNCAKQYPKALTVTEHTDLQCHNISGNVMPPNDIQNAVSPDKEIELRSTSSGWPQRVDKPGNGDIQNPEAQIVSEDLQSRDISGDMVPPNYTQNAESCTKKTEWSCPNISESMSSTQAGVREIGLQSVCHPSSSSIPFTEFQSDLKKPTFPSQERENYINGDIGRDLNAFRNHTRSLSEQIRYMNNPSHYKPVEIPAEKLRFSSENVYSINDSGSSRPKMKKNKLSTNGGNGCNCVHSRCFQLYCRCFEAQLYCSDSCTCQGCLNKIENESLIIEKVQKILSQNEHAFDSKITELSTDDFGEDRFNGKPMHINGCSCKKSRCLQNYCECFKFTVGCSDRCRCEGCQNSYGQKGESTTIVKPTLQHVACLTTTNPSNNGQTNFTTCSFSVNSNSNSNSMQ